MIKYRGGKSKEIPRLIWHVPRFKGRYIEPFFGGGAMFFHLQPRNAVINDINSKLMGFYAGVRNDFNHLRAELDDIERIYATNRAEYEALKAQTPDERVIDKNEALYYKLRDMYNGLTTPTYSAALLYYYINKTAYSGMIRTNAKGEFNVPYGRYKNLNTHLVTQAHSQLLNRAKLYNTDYSVIFDLCGPDDFVFLDPPYDCTFSDYGNEEFKDGFSEDNHRRLAEDFRNLPCKAMMVIGKTPLTEELYGPYITDEYDKTYAVNIRNRFKAGAKHIVVVNYDKNNETNPAHYEFELETAQAMLFEEGSEYGTH